jgi:hypothetical protein
MNIFICSSFLTFQLEQKPFHVQDALVSLRLSFRSTLSPLSPLYRILNKLSLINQIGHHQTRVYLKPVDVETM